VGGVHPLVFHGTEAEAKDLAVAVERNCGCARLRDIGAAEPTLCSAHAMLLGASRADQRALDGLIYVRRMLRARMFEREFGANSAVAE
jgi:hypothetical protein